MPGRPYPWTDNLVPVRGILCIPFTDLVHSADTLWLHRTNFQHPARCISDKPIVLFGTSMILENGIFKLNGFHLDIRLCQFQNLMRQSIQFLA